MHATERACAAVTYGSLATRSAGCTPHRYQDTSKDDGDGMPGLLEAAGGHNDDWSTHAHAKGVMRALTLVLLLGCATVVVECIGGWYAKSVSVLSDAAHMMSDVVGFLVSLVGFCLAQREPTARLSYGWHRTEIIGSLVSILLIWLVTAVLVYEAAQRILHPTPNVDGALMSILAFSGLVVNVIMAWILHASGHAHSHGGATSACDGHSHGEQSLAANVNIRSAFVHVVGDAVQSIGVIFAGLVIWYNPEWQVVDPLCAFSFSVIVLWTTLPLARDSIHVLMEGVPVGVSTKAVLRDLCALEHVLDVYELHIWSLSVGQPALSAHVHIEHAVHHATVLAQARALLLQRYCIAHVTLQIEAPRDESAMRSSAA